MLIPSRIGLFSWRMVFLFSRMVRSTRYSASTQEQPVRQHTSRMMSSLLRDLNTSIKIYSDSCFAICGSIDSILSELFANDLHQHALLPAAIEFAIEDLLPGAKIELPFGDGNHHLAPHHLALQMRVRVVLAGAIVPVG